MLRNVLTLVMRKLADLAFEVTGDSTAGWLRLAQFSLSRIQHGRPLAVGCGVYVKQQGSLSIGSRCALGSFTRIWNYAPIEIGDDFMAAGGLTLNSATHDPVTLQPRGEPITIGSRVWCGQNVTILAGVTIGDDVVIGAGSVVTESLPARCIAVGVPARKIRDLDRASGISLYSWARTTITVPASS
jgi:maltose O-acetyltransferase